MCFILDLHYSHKGEVVEILRHRNITPVYIPAGCTDLHQVCDVVVNKPFKNGARQAFSDYLSRLFAQTLIGNGQTEEQPLFQADLSLSIMKPIIPLFVQKGIQKLQTPNMIVSIKNCFHKQGLLGIAKMPETISMALQKFPAQIVEAAPQELEVEEDLGIVDDDGDDDINANPMNELSHFDIEVNVDHSDSDSEASESLLDELGTEALNSSSAYSKELTIL
jgi:hypothetical protein